MHWKCQRLRRVWSWTLHGRRKLHWSHSRVPLSVYIYAYTMVMLPCEQSRAHEGSPSLIVLTVSVFVKQQWRETRGTMCRLHNHRTNKFIPVVFQTPGISGSPCEKVKKKKEKKRVGWGESKRQRRRRKKHASRATIRWYTCFDWTLDNFANCWCHFMVGLCKTAFISIDTLEITPTARLWWGIFDKFHMYILPNVGACT